ncbi:MAG: DUF6390 family protein [Nanoarchaeota archaeon]
MDSIELVARYSFITNKLRYCGPEESYLKFLEYIKNPNEKLANEIKSYIKRFEGLYPYLQLIAKKHGLDEFDYKVMEAYWLGNELLDKFTETDLKEIIFTLTKRGLPKSYAEKLTKNIPSGMLPHHSFNVIYVGVGKVTGSVKFNLENINNCLIRPGKVVKSKEKTAIIQHRPYRYDKGKLELGNPIEEEFDNQFNSLKKGDTVSIHWKFIVDKLTEEQYSNLLKYNFKNIQALNNSIL